MMGRNCRVKAERRRSPASVIAVGLILLAAVMLVLPSISAAQQKAAPAKTLKIGYVLCANGWFRVMDAVEEKNLKIVEKMLNEKGGITVQGQKYNIELVGEDGNSTLDGVTAAATKLVYDHKIKFVVGPQGFFATASGPVFEQNKVIHVSGFNTCQPGELDASTPYGFLGFNGSIGATMATLKVIQKEYPKAKKIAFVTADDGAIPYLMPKVKKLLPTYGYTMAGDTIAFPNQMEDFSPIAAKVNSLKDADICFMLNGSPVAVGLVAKGLRALGNKIPVVHSGVPSCQTIMDISGKDAADDIISMSITPHAKGNPPLLDEIYDRSKTAEANPNFYALVPNSLWILTRVIQAANSLDPAVVKAKWETMDKVECLYGTCTFGGDETYGLKHHAVGHPQAYQKLVKGKVVDGGWVDVGRIP
jgi:branched-chain amino acid transport system substrate-binding protein